MERDFIINTADADETLKFGEEFSSKLNNGDVIALYGDLGSGKTHLVKGICKGLGVQQVVNSPTFIIVNEYTSAKFPKIFHFDLYRIRSEDELLGMGFMDYMNERGIVFIEWPEHAERLLPKNTIRIHLSHTDGEEHHRWIKLELPSV
jgi:tRNA threonylcarbamoyladenosine biosynthesis protein TsaE